jgi:stalled ribosome rescue protein Dom34
MNIMQKKLNEVVNNQEKYINQIIEQLDRYATKLDYATVLNPANMENRLQKEVQETESNQKLIAFKTTYRLLNGNNSP